MIGFFKITPAVGEHEYLSPEAFEDYLKQLQENFGLSIVKREKDWAIVRGEVGEIIIDRRSLFGLYDRSVGQ